MNLRLTVVKKDGELLFKDGESGLLFDRLDAQYSFIGGKLTISRRGRVFDRTDNIGEVGTHAPGPAFCGLGRLFKGGSFLAHYAMSLDPSDLREGDRLVIRMPEGTPKKFTLAVALFESQNYSAILRKIMKRRGGRPISLGQLLKEFRAELAKGVPARTPILRFKEPE